jgi:hypothetical protein
VGTGNADLHWLRDSNFLINVNKRGGAQNPHHVCYGRELFSNLMSNGLKKLSELDFREWQCLIQQPLQLRDGALPGESCIPFAVVKRFGEERGKCLTCETLLREQNEGITVPLL